MNHYCTYFDSGYLAQGLALWESLSRFDPSGTLWILALDSRAEEALRARQGNGIRVLALGDLLASDPELAATRAGRPRNEFIFTLTPCLMRHLFGAHREIERICYLDADLYFFADPSPAWNDLGEGSVLVVSHRFPEWHDDAPLYGLFNVGLLIFRRDERGRACVEWWRERCLESCALSADGIHYGDQKYLDEWPRRFAGVVESKHPGVNLAPWNWARHRIDVSGAEVVVDGERLIVFHFAQFRRIGARWCDSGQLEYGIMPRRIRSRLYGEYSAALEAAEASVRKTIPDFSIPTRSWASSLGPWHLALLRLFWGQFWFRMGGTWLSLGVGPGQSSGRAMGAYRRRKRGRI